VGNYIANLVFISINRIIFTSRKVKKNFRRYHRWFDILSIIHVAIDIMILNLC
jgi:hypothetical protein